MGSIPVGPEPTTDNFTVVDGADQVHKQRQNLKIPRHFASSEDPMNLEKRKRSAEDDSKRKKH